MSINKIRSAMYRTAKVMGDVQAVTHQKPIEATAKRAGRRVMGNIFARIMRAVFPPTRGK